MARQRAEEYGHAAMAVRVAHAARIADVSPRTIRRWIDRGVLPAVRIGGVRLVLLAELERLLARGA